MLLESDLTVYLALSLISIYLAIVAFYVAIYFSAYNYADASSFNAASLLQIPLFSAQRPRRELCSTHLFVKGARQGRQEVFPV